MRKFARKDRNHVEILDAFRDMGCAVLDLSHEGNGVPDALVAVRYRGGYTYTLVEIKDGTKSPSARKLTPEQRVFHEKWPDAIPIVTSVDDATRLVTAIWNGLSYV